MILRKQGICSGGISSREESSNQLRKTLELFCLSSDTYATLTYQQNRHKFSKLRNGGCWRSVRTDVPRWCDPAPSGSVNGGGPARAIRCSNSEAGSLGRMPKFREDRKS